VNFCSYFVERGVCYLVLCEKSFSKRQAFAYLEELQTEFAMQYGQKFGNVSRPYSFIEFGKHVLIQLHELCLFIVTLVIIGGFWVIIIRISEYKCQKN